MKFIEITDIGKVLPLHEKIFGEKFPMESYNKKINKYPLTIYLYTQDDIEAGYSIIIDKIEEKSIYAWYGGVLPKFQGNGITSELLNFLIFVAKNKGYDSVTFATSNLRPHMICLAVKMGFDITDIKKRTEGEGNKIYFRYNILPEIESDIHLIDEKGEFIDEVHTERLIIEAFKKNTVKYNLYGKQNILAFDYAIKYLKSLKKTITISIIE